MNRNEESLMISPTQLVFLVFGIIVGTGFITLPRGVIEKAREDAWLTVILALGIALVSLWLILRVASIFPKDTAITYNVKLFGRTFGLLLNLFLAVYFLFFTITGVRTMAEVVKTEMLPFTPLGIIIGSMLLVLLYCSWDGLMPVVRINESGIPTSIFMIIFFFSLAYPAADWHELRIPFLEGVTPVIQSLPSTSYSFLGYEILFLYYPFIFQKKKAYFHTAIGIGTAGIFYTFVVLGTLVTLGPNMAIAQTYPVITMAKIIEIVPRFVERAELLLIILWLPLAYTTHLITFFSTAFALNNTFPRISLRWWMMLSLPFIFILSMLPDNLMQMERWTKVTGACGLFLLTGYPVLLLTCVFVRRKLGLLPKN
ncbi:GerAB/ArcD/ProY family transporter [Aneurinibacillus sp. UBA3580]|uniref:GerAB/ArcD/ProY family transporter n=1 Tax=Aneurinibacillus sp. UBA3580 TaxID=1946041 RepID=UPI00257B0A3F|nr:GerAB/ArcD/ProY family transporter [Aneurinibacillus sp. UBA3580]